MSTPRLKVRVCFRDQGEICIWLATVDRKERDDVRRDEEKPSVVMAQAPLSSPAGQLPPSLQSSFSFFYDLSNDRQLEALCVPLPESLNKVSCLSLWL